MTEKELRRALLNLDATTLSGAADARQLTWRILERDRRRMRRLSGVTVGVWLLAAAMVLAALVGFGFLFPQQAQLLNDIDHGKLTAAQREEAQRALLVGFQKGTLMMGFSVAVLALAALCTVLLIFVSRRATLRQINSSLVEISEQLQRLREPPGP
jgi:hypothetical protein